MNATHVAARARFRERQYATRYCIVCKTAIIQPPRQRCTGCRVTFDLQQAQGAADIPIDDPDRRARRKATYQRSRARNRDVIAERGLAFRATHKEATARRNARYYADNRIAINAARRATPRRSA